jgi:hypothetical protein
MEWRSVCSADGCPALEIGWKALLSTTSYPASGEALDLGNGTEEAAGPGSGMGGYIAPLQAAHLVLEMGLGNQSPCSKLSSRWKCDGSSMVLETGGRMYC